MDNIKEAEKRIQKAYDNKNVFLSLSELSLPHLPESLFNLTNLQTLYISRNQLTTIPESIGNLNNLQILDISRNQLTTIPGAIGNLNNLQILYIYNNQLTTIPNSLENLTNLQELDIYNNQLTSIPESIECLNNLRKLHLYNNQLTLIPESLGNLNNLRILELSGNQLTTIPESIGNLNNLQKLYLFYNQLTTIPESLGNLTNLQGLYIFNNQLTTIPETIGNLTNLQILYLYNNQLTTIPESLKKLKRLKVLYLHNNKELSIPLEILGPKAGKKHTTSAKPTDILNYYFNIVKGKRPLNEAKLILVGHGTVGKTSIVNRLANKIFYKEEKKTEGINITGWPVKLNSDEDVKLNIWDFGGQEIMHSTHQFFLTERSLYLLVLNGRQGHEDMDAEYWLNLIKSFGGDSPVIIVLNKINEHPFDLNRRGLQEKFPSIRGFIKTDCEDNTGIDQLNDMILNETDRLEHLRDSFPAAWFDIKDEMTNMEENYITFDRYQTICEKKDIKDQKSQESLAFCLHSLGIALNYKDDPRLRDTHVLNPHWVTEGIYKLLNAENLEKQKGELFVKDLPTILDAEKYPTERHLFLFELMRKFELCFNFPDEMDHYLIPELLDKQQPEKASHFKPEDCLNFQYHYNILPEGLLPKFIVRTHVLSREQPRWRTGVILKFEGNLALVKADAHDNRISISISGPIKSRRRLLSVIRSNFEHIHSGLKFNPVEMVPVPKFPQIVISYEELIVMERNGIETFPKVVDGDVITVNVRELLNSIDLEGSRKTDEHKEPNTVKPDLSMFVSYSHKDDELRDQLVTHLTIFQRQKLINIWHDRRLIAGDDWKGKIDENLEKADIILLLVSSDFIASEYCYDVEMKRALERHDDNDAVVIPIIVRDVKWSLAPFAKLEALPTDGKAVTVWKNRDSAWENVADGIEKVINNLRVQFKSK